MHRYNYGCTYYHWLQSWIILILYYITYIILFYIIIFPLNGYNIITEIALPNKNILITLTVGFWIKCKYIIKTKKEVRSKN